MEQVDRLCTGSDDDIRSQPHTGCKEQTLGICMDSGYDDNIFSFAARRESAGSSHGPIIIFDTDTLVPNDHAIPCADRSMARLPIAMSVSSNEMRKDLQDR
jgi:hypothetical protein